MLNKDGKIPTPRLMGRRRAIYTLGCAGVSLAAGLLLGCEREAVQTEKVWTSPYDWDSVMTNARGRMFYYPNGQLNSRFGIDVSDHEGPIDWQLVAADGVEFALVRVGYRGYTKGGLIADEQFENNIDGALSNGIMTGAYMFSSAINEKEAKEEADYAIEMLAGRSLEYPVVFDQEPVPDQSGRANKLSNKQYTANAKAFCSRVVEAGYQAMIYGNQHHLAKLQLKELADYPIWYAEYGVSKPTGEFDFTMWQYATDGAIEGIESAVDMNIHFLSFD